MSTPIFSNRVLVPRHRNRNRTKEDEELVKHTQGILYPFHTEIWNPTFPEQRPTRKLRLYARGQTTTSSAAGDGGWGYVYISPNCANNATSAFFAVNSPTLAADTFANPVVASRPNSPYASGDFLASGLKSRISSCCLRVRNITPMLNRGGTLYAMRSPDDEPLPTGFFDVQIGELDVTGNSWRCDTSGGKWSYLPWAPRERDQMEFSITSGSVTANNNGAQMQRTLAFVFQAPSLSFPQTYEYEYVMYVEILGGGLVNEQIHGATRGESHPDTEKVHQIVSILHTKPAITETEGNNALSGFIVDCVKAGHGVQSIVNAACDVAGRISTVLPQALAATRALGSFL